MAMKDVKPGVEEIEQVDPWSIKKTVNLPRGGRNEATSVFVRLNNQGFQVPRGKPVEVPAPIAERLEILLRAEDDQYNFLKGLDDQNVPISD